MKTILTAALLALVSVSAHADGISCTEMAQMINDYEAKKKSGNMSRAEKVSIPSLLAASYNSFRSAKCSESLLNKTNTKK